jgi:hypothetical protein
MITTLSRWARRTISVSFFVLVASSFAFAQPNPARPYNAHLVTTTTSVTPVSTTEVLLTYVATGQGTHVGDYQESGFYVLDLVTFTFSGSATATAADGSTFSFTITGGFTGATTLEGTASVTDGTGRFAGVTGELSFTGDQTSPINIAAQIKGWLQF